MNHYYYCLHRGGSSVIGEMINYIAAREGLQCNLIGDMPTGANFHEVGGENAAFIKTPIGMKLNMPEWERRHGIFGPIRFAPSDDPFSGLLVFNTRDVRDIMVSGYYGFLRLHSGGLSNPGNASNYDLGIDNYVVRVLAPFMKNNITAFTRYFKETREAHRHLKYETMIGNFDEWSRALFDFFGYSPKTLHDFVGRFQHEFRPPDTEQIDSHKRAVVANQYLAKLKPETIQFLNEYFEEYLKTFHYL